MGGSNIHLYPHVAVSLPPVPSRGGLAETVLSTGFSRYDPQAEGGDAGPMSTCSPKYKPDCPSAGLHHEILIRKLVGQQQGSGKRVAAGDVDDRGHAAASVHPAIGVCWCGVIAVALQAAIGGGSGLMLSTARRQREGPQPPSWAPQPPLVAASPLPAAGFSLGDGAGFSLGAVAGFGAMIGGVLAWGGFGWGGTAASAAGAATAAAESTALARPWRRRSTRGREGRGMGKMTLMVQINMPRNAL